MEGGSGFGLSLRELFAEPLESDVPRPRTRGDCVDGPRPCPWLGCRHHLAIDVASHSGDIRVQKRELDEMPDTCALDVADRGNELLNSEIAELLGVSRQRVDAIFHDAMKKIHLRVMR